MTWKIRASSVAEFIDCPLRWFTKHIEGVLGVATPPTLIGSACHASTAAYDASRLIVDDSKWISVDDAAEVLVQTLKDPEYEVDWGDVSYKEAERRALGVHMRYCEEIAPRMVYSEVEKKLEKLTVRVDLPNGGSADLEITGTLDRIYEEAHEWVENQMPMAATRRGIADVKSGARACSQNPGKHKAQLAVYELLAENSGVGKIDAPAQILQLQTSGNFQVGIAEVENARLALLGKDSQKGLLHHIAGTLESGNFYGNSSSMLCHEKYCPRYDRCIFR